MDKKFYDALTSSIYANCMAQAGRDITTDDQRIRASGLFTAWAPGVHEQGDLCNALGQTWECHAAINDNHNPGVEPGTSAWPTFWRPLHGKTPLTARPFAQPQYGTTDIYHTGECMIWTDGRVLRALRDTNFSPDDSPTEWEDTET